MADGEVVARIFKANAAPVGGRRGCGRYPSATTKTARRRTAMSRRARPRWRRSQRPGGGSDRARSPRHRAARASLNKQRQPPLRMRSAYDAARRNSPSGLAPSDSRPPTSANKRLAGCSLPRPYRLFVPPPPRLSGQREMAVNTVQRIGLRAMVGCMGNLLRIISIHRISF
jgi:hypothetical protein